ncbi:IS3 family transposase [Nocardia pseudobrasiliensis]|uniref:Transposase InsO family protein n=1 Tax=Nocardia pseudobrasiliensis TaxID=45979 RepID=A0A370HL99_9NOCA|nr:IS3 family transposase [Nocardia pseudobrasiliensis]RDI58935.1 transposase InsO family protein [Nocardia pseudobrasiliensis]
MKFAAIADWVESGEFESEFMCRELGVSRSGYYAWRGRGVSGRAREDAELTTLIGAIHDKLRGNPGVRRVHAALVVAGRRVARKRVWRLMRAAGLRGRHPKAFRRTTVRGGSPVAAPDLIGRDFAVGGGSGRRWCGDITYVKTWAGWAYLATVIDLHDRSVIGWAIADHMRTSLVTDALDMALGRRKPKPGVIFHSDRGTQYTSKEFDAYCHRNRIRRSLGRTGSCFDNAVSESLFATYKKELIHTRPWPTLDSVRWATFDWIENYYNTHRRHSALCCLVSRCARVPVRCRS